MKTITLRDSGAIKAKEIIMQTVKVAPQGMDLAQMRRRIRILDALDKANGKLELEDADFAILKQAIEAQQWTVADSALLEIIEDVLNA